MNKDVALVVATPTPGSRDEDIVHPHYRCHLVTTRVLVTANDAPTRLAKVLMETGSVDTNEPMHRLCARMTRKLAAYTYLRRSTRRFCVVVYSMHNLTRRTWKRIESLVKRDDVLRTVAQHGIYALRKIDSKAIADHKVQACIMSRAYAKKEIQRMSLLRPTELKCASVRVPVLGNVGVAVFGTGTWKRKWLDLHWKQTNRSPLPASFPSHLFTDFEGVFAFKRLPLPRDERRLGSVRDGMRFLRGRKNGRIENSINVICRDALTVSYVDKYLRAPVERYILVHRNIEGGKGFALVMVHRHKDADQRQHLLVVLKVLCNSASHFPTKMVGHRIVRRAQRLARFICKREEAPPVLYVLPADKDLSGYYGKFKFEPVGPAVHRKYESLFPGIVSTDGMLWRPHVKSLKGGRRKKNGSKRKNGSKKVIAIKKDPKLWKQCKAAAMKKFKKHSARAMQWASRLYKKRGGKYAGKKKATNSLSVWTKQKWTTSDGRKSEGKRRYLPREAWKHLTKSQIAATNRAKAKGHERGKQYVRQPKDVARVSARFRK